MAQGTGRPTPRLQTAEQGSDKNRVTPRKLCATPWLKEKKS
jgi:hypothetical protein